MDRALPMALTISALLGLSLATAACGASQAGTASSQRSTLATTGSGAATPAPSPPVTTPPSAASSPSAGVPTASATAAPASPAPGVVADCIRAPHTLRTRPSSVVLACADDGLGVEKMTWTTWTASTATGQGTLWEKLCKPNCADGTTGTYPVAIALSDVKTSSHGPWFSLLTVTWEGTRPPSPAPGSFPLPPPVP